MGLVSEGTVLKRGNGATPEVFTEVGEVVSMGGLGGGSPTVIDLSHLGSRFRRKALGLRDEGQVTMQLQWTGGEQQHAEMWADRAAGTLRNFQITYPDNTQDEFAAYVMTFESNPSTDSALTINCTLEIDDEVDRAWPSES